MADKHLDDELRVDQTTPQGSQENAVEHGHEERDANVGGIMKWLVGTGIVAAVALAFVVVIFKTLDRVTDTPSVPSPLLLAPKARLQKVQGPYIEGLVVDGERSGMTEHLLRVRRHESEQLASWKLGESDVYTWSVPLQNSDARGITGAPAGDEAGTDWMFGQGQLSDASGGMKPNPQR